MFSVSITHHLKIRELNDKIRVMSYGNMKSKQASQSWVPQFLNYGWWKQSYELWKHKIQTPPKWSTISPQQRHIIHQSTKSKPLSLKLSRKQSFHARKCFKFFIFKIKNKKLCSPIANPSVKWTSTKMNEISLWG